MKIIKIALVCTIAVVVTCFGGACTTTSETTDTTGISSKFTKSYTYDMVKGVAPEGGFKIYLDASGSMPGYFTDGLTDYIKIVSGLQGGSENTKVYFWGDTTHEITNLNSTITNGNYKAKSSLFPDIFKVMAEDVKNEKALTFLVTDGIVSNSSSVTGKRTGYTISDLPLLPSAIKKGIGDSLAVAVFRFTIPFGGTYWDIDNKQKKLDNINRPLFVFAIGYPEAVSYLKESLNKNNKQMQNFIGLDPKQLYMGIIKKKKNQNAFRDVNFTFDSDSNDVKLASGSDSFEIAVDIPKWISESGINPDNDGTLSIKHEDGKEVKVDKKYNNSTLTVSTNDHVTFDIGRFFVDYYIVMRSSDGWQEYSCDDDRNISSDSSLYDKTFGLKEILKGFELATGQPDTLFKSSFEFKYE